MPDITTAELQALNRPIEGIGADSTLKVTVDAAKPLALGSYTFQLEVVDESGNRSAPATIRLTVFDNQAPTAVIEIAAPVANTPKVPFGTNFVLSGKNSFDSGGGRIAKYVWTRVS